MKQINIALCGLGVVGSASLNILQQQAQKIYFDTGIHLIVSHVLWRSAKYNLDLDNILTTTDPKVIIQNSSIDIIVELIGGVTAAKDLVISSLKAGKHVVTANKHLLSKHGDEIYKVARENKVVVAFEAAVGGCIPIIKSVREALGANDIDAIYGIINGTSNFILTQMSKYESVFTQVLEQAQQLGYAEADPTFDVGGVDAAHKISILARLAFGLGNCLDKIYTEGITDIKLQDIRYAKALGYVVKHLGVAKKINSSYSLAVYPALISSSHLLAQVDGVVNGVMVSANYSGQTFYIGAGAGGDATASAVVADIIQVARRLIVQDNLATDPSGCALYVNEPRHDKSQMLSIGNITNSFYIRITAENNSLDTIKKIFMQHNIQVESKELVSMEKKDHIFFIPAVIEAYLDAAVSEINNLKGLTDTLIKIRIEQLIQV